VRKGGRGTALNLTEAEQRKLAPTYKMALEDLGNYLDEKVRGYYSFAAFAEGVVERLRQFELLALFIPFGPRIKLDVGGSAGGAAFFHFGHVVSRWMKPNQRNKPRPDEQSGAYRVIFTRDLTC
jgi:hypothetical protein